MNWSLILGYWDNMSSTELFFTVVALLIMLSLVRR